MRRRTGEELRIVGARRGDDAAGLVVALVLVACGPKSAGSGDSTGDTSGDSTGGMTVTSMPPGMTGPGPTAGPEPTTTPDPSGATATSSSETTTLVTTAMTTDPTADPTGAGEATFCQEACTADADCTVQGMDFGLVCEDDRCVGADQCDDDDDCVALFSGWIQDCASQDVCSPLGQACIDPGDGAGVCATHPTDFLKCEDILQMEVMRPLIEDGTPIVVCANDEVVCNVDGLCEDPCADDGECASFPGHPVCDMASGKCTCGSDADCAGADVPGFAVCIDGRCGCAADSDCVGELSDTCFAGSCGCSSVAACTADEAFDGTMMVCAGL